MKEERTLEFRVLFSERVLPSFFSFLPLVLIPASIWLVLLPIIGNWGLFIGTVLAIVVGALMIYSSPRIQIIDGSLVVNQAHLRVEEILKVEPISAEDMFEARGRKLDARAFLALQSSVKTGIRITLRPSSDPTPYWLVSSRRAQQICSILPKK